MINENCREYTAAQEKELYELLVQLAQIPAPTGKEGRRAEFCRNWLEEHGASGVYMDGAGNVIWPYRAGAACRSGRRQENTGQRTGDGQSTSERDTAPLVVFDAHMDVVFPDETQLPLTERDGRICCPGVGDDTANLAVLLMTAAYAAKYQPDTGEYGILFVCGTGEEGLGNLSGVRELCAAFGERIAAFYALDLTMEAYTCRAVGSLRYRMEVQTPGGHSYLCFGNTNANAVLAEIIRALYEIRVPERGRTTYNVGMISGGTSVNTIAQQAELLYEIRSDEEQDLKEMEQRFEQVLEQCRRNCPQDSRIMVQMIGERPCEHAVDPVKREWMFRQVERVVSDAAGSVPVPEPCSTDCNIPLSMGIPSVCIGTCRGAGAHTREEYIEKDSLIQGLQIALELLEDVKRLFR